MSEIEDEHYLSIAWAGVNTVLMPRKAAKKSKAASNSKPLLVRASPLKPQKPSKFLKYIPKFQALRDYYGFWHMIKDRHSGEDNEKHIDLDFIPGGDLDHFFFISNDPKNKFPVDGYDQGQKLIILYGVARLLEFMHTNLNIVHGDISPYTIFLDHQLKPIIAPIRVTYKYSRAGGNGIPRIDFVAPEIFNGDFDIDKNATEKSDVYMFGMTILAVAKHGYPYDIGTKKSSIGDKIKNGELPDLAEIIAENPQLKNSPLLAVYEKCVKSNPEERATMTEVCEELKKIGSKIAKFNDYVKYLNSKIGKKVEGKGFGGENLLGSIENLETAAKKKIPFALETLGEMLSEGEIIKKDEKRGEAMLNELDEMQDTKEEEEDDVPEEEDDDDDEGDDDDIGDDDDDDEEEDIDDDEEEDD